MTDLRMWSDLSPSERAEAVTKAREVIAGGVTRWAVIARLCGLSGGNSLRCEIDHEWRDQQMAESRERAAKRRSVARAALPFDKTASQRRAYAERGRRAARLKAMRGSIGKARKKGALLGMLASASLGGSSPITLPTIKFMQEGT